MTSAVAGREAVRQPSPLPLAGTPTTEGGATRQVAFNRLAGRGVEGGWNERVVERGGREDGEVRGGGGGARGLVLRDVDYVAERERMAREEGEEEMDMEEEEEEGGRGMHLAAAAAGGAA